jgi:hypothetical protein
MGFNGSSSSILAQFKKPKPVRPYFSSLDKLLQRGKDQTEDFLAFLSQFNRLWQANKFLPSPDDPAETEALFGEDPEFYWGKNDLEKLKNVNLDPKIKDENMFLDQIKDEPFDQSSHEDWWDQPLVVGGKPLLSKGAKEYLSIFGDMSYYDLLAPSSNADLVTKNEDKIHWKNSDLDPDEVYAKGKVEAGQFAGIVDEEDKISVGQIWTALQKAGYISEDGYILPQFDKDNEEEFKLELEDIALSDGEKESVFKILKKATTEPKASYEEVVPFYGQFIYDQSIEVRLALALYMYKDYSLFVEAMREILGKEDKINDVTNEGDGSQDIIETYTKEVKEASLHPFHKSLLTSLALKRQPAFHAGIQMFTPLSELNTVWNQAGQGGLISTSPAVLYSDRFRAAMYYTLYTEIPALFKVKGKEDTAALQKWEAFSAEIWNPNNAYIGRDAPGWDLLTTAALDEVDALLPNTLLKPDVEHYNRTMDQIFGLGNWAISGLDEENKQLLSTNWTLNILAADNKYRGLYLGERIGANIIYRRAYTEYEKDQKKIKEEEAQKKEEERQTQKAYARQRARRREETSQAEKKSKVSKVRLNNLAQKQNQIKSLQSQAAQTGLQKRKDTQKPAQAKKKSA